jgi:hypothetical protein
LIRGEKTVKEEVVTKEGWRRRRRRMMMKEIRGREEVHKEGKINKY